MNLKNTQITNHGIVWRTRPRFRSRVDALARVLPGSGQAEIVKSSTVRRVVGLEILQGAKPLQVVVKHHRLRWSETLRDFFSISKARKEWDMTHRIAKFGIHTVVPIAYEEIRWGKLLRESYLVSEGLQFCESLDEYVIRESAKNQPQCSLKSKRELI